MSRRFISLLVLLASLFMSSGAFARAVEPKDKAISADASVISTWNIINAELNEDDSWDAAYEQLMNVYNDYYQYYDYFTPGTKPGQYGETEVAVFRAVLDKVAELDSPDGNPGDLTAEDLNNIAEEIKTAYEAVVKSFVNLTMADGYYRIKTGGLHYNADKYMYVTKNGTTMNGVWGSVEDLGSDAPSLWKVTNMGDSQYVLENMAFDAQFNPSTGTSAPFTLQTDHTELMCITASAYENNNIYVNIRVASQTGDYVYLHQGDHANGAGKGGNVVAWYANAEPSQWLFVPVSDEDAQKIIDDYAPIKKRAAMLAAYDSIMTNAKANLEIARERRVEVKVDEKMITSSSQFSSPYTEESEGSIEYMLDNDNSTFWHSQWAGGTVPMDYHYLQVEIKDVNVETAVAVIGRRNTYNDQVTAMNVRGTNDPDAEKDECELLANIKTPFVERGEMGVVSDIFELKGYKYLRFYPTTTESEYDGMTNRGYFHLAEFQLYPAEMSLSKDALYFKLGELFTNLEAIVNAQKDMDEEDIELAHYNELKAAYDAFMVQFTILYSKKIAYEQLISVYNDYYQYYDYFTPGTKPGQYGIEEVAAFRAALDKVAELDGPDSNLDEMTAEDINLIVEEIKATYEAVKNSLVSLTLASGYYRIRNGGLVYTETRIDEETGQSETITIDKYMYVTEGNDELNGVWGSVEDLGSDAPSLWKVTNMGDSQYVLENTAFDAQFNPSAGPSAPFTLQTDHTELMCITASTYEDDNIYVNIRVASQTGDYVYLHQGGHANGAGKSGNLVAWSTEPTASQWLFVPVSGEEAQKIIDDYHTAVKERSAMLAAYDSIMTNAKANLEIARERRVEVQVGEKMITSSSQFSSPYTEESEGSIEYMLDNDNSTFWHSQWAGGTVPMDYHYLQVEIIDANVESALAVIGRRTATQDHVTAMNVRGTNDPDAEKDECELLANIKIPFIERGEMGVMSDIFEFKGYKYLRFYPTTTENVNGSIDNRGYFHLAEFQLYPVETYQSETAQCFALGELFTNLEAVVSVQEGLNEDDIHIKEYNALKEAYDAFMERFVDPTLLREMIVKLNGIPFGTELGQYQSTISISDWDSTKIAIDELVNNGAYRDALDLVENLFAHTTINQPKGKFVHLYAPAHGIYLEKIGEDGHISMGIYREWAGIYYITEDGHLWNYDKGLFTENAYDGIQSASYGDMGATWEFGDAQGFEWESRYNIWDNDHAYLLCGSDFGSSTLPTHDLEKRAAWRFIEVTEVPVTITETGYTTLYSPVALAIPEYITAYTGTVDDAKTSLTLTALDGVIPAETAVIIEGYEGTYSFKVAEDAEPVENNDLTGNLAGVADANDLFSLQNLENGMGFYRYTRSTLSGVEAYLNLTDAVDVEYLLFNFGLTDNITTVDSETIENAVIYNLAGQRVEKAVKGVYIVNGKKVMVK